MNLHTPSRTQVDAALQAIADEERRQREAVDAFYAREAAAAPVISWKVALLGLFLGGAAVAWGAWWLITTVLDKIGF